MKIGIVGLPNVGKSTIFNALTKAGAESANYPFCTIDPNVGVVTVPDPRLTVLEKMYTSKKVVPTTIEFVDIAGLVKGASKGEGLGNKFLSHIREVDAIAHVVRCFEDDNVVHVEGKIDPIDDLETINLELIFADIEMLDRRIDKNKKIAKTNAQEKANLEIAMRLREILEGGKMPNESDFNADEWDFIQTIQLISTKPVLYIANVSEDDLLEDNEMVKRLKATVAENYSGEHKEIIKISAKIEEEIAQFDDEEKAEFLAELGLASSGLDQVIQAGYKLLGLITFLTAGPDECRAWTVTAGTKAPQAAGKIHSDIERGFIRAEITSYDQLIAAGSDVKARETGVTRIEGKEYVMKDGDVTFFRFNV
ncbi:redox-regulated ATPase YchF [Acetobacterium fimetarium]|uniref:Ribosome-binding ATPase YchF n=1 Tax=Acetobacterium fimetarium TaxID=52691 RepID=A0ABR6WRV1_9FIRM|nr:redox-regulated ATPase YchF [Acetobacterium fimetarium]MBC3803250.1 redox-regulated ATPase YchF [Acetobacterium fimetarium]